MTPTTRVDLLPPELPDDVTVLDVREPEEWAAGHVEGAVHIPLGTLPVRAHEVPEGRLLFPDMSVGERIELGAVRARNEGRNYSERVDWVQEMFPVLLERRDQKAGITSEP